MRFLVGLLIIPALLTAQSNAESHPVFVDVLVRSKTGPVTGLTKDDFVLKDKGKVQRVEFFAATPARDPNLMPVPLAPGTAANQLNTRGEPLAAATIILFDRLNTPALDQTFARQQVLALLGSLKETDTVAFASLWRTFTLVQDFTSDAGPLIRSARRITAGSPAGDASAAEMELQKKLESSLVITQEIDQVARPPITAVAFRSIATHLAGIPGRKSLIWVARSFPLTFGADTYRRNETANELAMTTAILQEGNVAVYPVSPGGVGSGFSDTSSRTDRPKEGTILKGANASVGSTDGVLSDSTNMQGIANATGGKAFNNLNDLVPAIRAVLDDNELTYTLGFRPDTRSLDEQMHSLDVDLVKGKAQGAEVRFRKKYLATPRNLRPATPLAQLALEPLEATELGFAAIAQPDPAKPGSQKVDLSIDPADLTMKHELDKWSGGFDLGLFVDGAPANSGTGKTFNFTLSEDQWKQVQVGGLVVDGSVPAKAGDTIHVVIRERSTRAAGSARVPVR